MHLREKEEASWGRGAARYKVIIILFNYYSNLNNNLNKLYRKEHLNIFLHASARTELADSMVTLGEL